MKNGSSSPASDKPLRILHVVGSAQLSSGGPIEGIRQRALILLKMGHSVEIASLDPEGSPDLDQLGVPAHPLGPVKYSFICPKLDQWLESNRDRFDVFIVNGVWQYNGLAVRRLAKKHRLPYFVFTHGMLDPWFNKQYPLKRIKKMAFWPWQYPVLRDANAVLFTTEEECVLARQSFQPYKVVERVVPYGTATPPDQTESQLKAFYEAAPLAQGKNVLLTLGRIHPKKGHDLLIQAFGKEFASDPSWVLAIAGPDQEDWRPELEAMAKGLGVSERIAWVGMVKGDAKWGAFHAAKAFILPSHQENFGISVAEALGCGVPVFISDKVNIWREVVAAGAGVVAPDTLEGTIELLRKLKALPPEALQAMGASAKLCFAQHFEVSRMATGLLDVIAELG